MLHFTTTTCELSRKYQVNTTVTESARCMILTKVEIQQTYTLKFEIESLVEIIFFLPLLLVSYLTTKHVYMFVSCLESEFIYPGLAHKGIVYSCVSKTK